MSDDTNDMTARLALESILRWVDRPGNAHLKLEGIGAVASTALGQRRRRRENSFNYQRMLQDLRDNDKAPGVTREPVSALNL